jgi:hypothetical protein
MRLPSFYIAIRSGTVSFFWDTVPP